MAAQTEPRSGLLYGWNYGENGWNAGMDTNLLNLGRFGFHLAVKGRRANTPPGSPVQGDTYLVGPAPTGAWADKAGQITLWSGATWVFAVPREGWACYVEDERVGLVYRANAWGVAFTKPATLHYTVVSRTLTAPPGSPTAWDTYIVAASPTGSWAGQAGNLATWNGTGWVFTVPKVGTLAYVVAEEKLSVFKAAGWSAGVAL